MCAQIRGQAIEHSLQAIQVANQLLSFDHGAEAKTIADSQLVGELLRLAKCDIEGVEQLPVSLASAASEMFDPIETAARRICCTRPKRSSAGKVAVSR